MKSIRIENQTNEYISDLLESNGISVLNDGQLHVTEVHDLKELLNKNEEVFSLHSWYLFEYFLKILLVIVEIVPQIVNGMKKLHFNALLQRHF